MVSYEFVTGNRTPLISLYLPTSTLEQLPDLEEALTRFRDQDPIFLRELNINIQAQNPCSQKVADMMMKFGMM